jgi:hypothetical protein
LFKGFSMGEVLTGIGIVVAAVAWAVRQEGRINLHAALHEEHAKRHAEIKEDVNYIRERIDRALNGVR